MVKNFTTNLTTLEWSGKPHELVPSVRTQKKEKSMNVKTLSLTVLSLLFAILFLSIVSCSQPFFPDPFFVRVASIEGVPETGETGTPITLTGIIRPAFASNVDIIWSVKDAGTTGAVINGNILYVNADGIVVITAIIPNGRATGKDFTQDFFIVIGSGVPPITKEDEYTIVILILDNESGDTVTVSPDKGKAGVTVTLSYTVADLKINNQLDFGGVSSAIAPVLEADTGTRTYTINAADSSNGVITITAIFTHTDLEIDHIAFSEHDGGHITKNYGDPPFTNAITNAHKGTGAITYHSSNESVATVDSTGTVTILAVGSTVISAEKAADTQYAHALTTYTLTVIHKPGSEENPFLVANEADLRKVGTGADGWTLSAHYRQIANIAMMGGNFTPIGDNTNRFTGVYDGDGYAIINLTVTGTTNSLGLFGVIGATGTVKNMNVTGTITQNGTQGIGGIAGANSGTIDNCSFSGTVTGSSSADQVGGITGYNYGTVINSRNTATVSGKNAIGGITGVNQGKLENSYNTGSVTGSQQVGGIAGVNTNSDGANYLKNCYNTGNVTAAAASNSHAGGIVGLNQLNAKVYYCYNTGNVTGSTAVGGIVGTNDNSSTSTFCVSLGAKVTGSSSVGRVAGTFPGLGNNKARADMKIGASGSEAVPTTNIGGGALNGADFGLGAASTSIVTDGWDSSIWNAVYGNLNIGDNLPTLKPNTQSPAPTLPAEYFVPGTAGNPFLVTNEADLRKVGSSTDGWTLSAHYRQTANIVLTSNFTRIGNDTTKFTGSYNGDGHTITGLSMTISSYYIGLFGYIGASGTVKNVNVTGTVSSDGTNRLYIGGITGMNEGTIDNCVFNGTINASATTNDQVGGIVGENGTTGTVSNSINNATVIGRNQIGGIAGQNNGTVINSSNNGSVTGNNQTGGIAGTAQGKVENCYNTGAVTGYQQVGGIAGTNVLSGNYIKNSYNTGDVTSTAPSNNNVGGITGFNQQSALVEYCYNTGVVTGATAVGGIAGNSASGTTVRNCVSLSVRLVGTGNTGRIVGNSPSPSLSGNIARELMFIGASGSTTTTIGSATDPNGLSVSMGVGQQGSVFAGWNYSTIWNISGNLVEGVDLPTLKDNTQIPAPTLPGSNPALGTAANPFLVANETDLRKVGTETAAGGWTLSAHYKQTMNITMTTSNFPKIGTSSTQFFGTYDGDGKTITNLTMTTTPTVYYGLFSSIGTTGIVKNLNVTGTITQSGYTNMGGIAGGNDGTIENCSFSGTINGGTYDNVGGIVGQNSDSGKVINSRSSATVSGRTDVGGIAGRNNGTIENCYNTGAVNGRNRVGGIAGINPNNGSIKNCYNTGDISATELNAGYGGIVGSNQNTATVEYCYNTGNVTGDSNVGGIAGGNAAGSSVKNSVSLGARVTGDSFVGRILGQNNGTLGNNIARSDMKIGASGAEAAVSPAGADTPNGSTVMFSANLSIVFSGWDTAVWNISGTFAIGGNLPTLKPNTQSPAPTVPAAYNPPGTAANPFEVKNEADLRKVGTGTDGWTLSVYYKQTANITMTTSNFTPIGYVSASVTNKFSGVYDGGGFTISGLNMTGTTNYLGLFGSIDAIGTVKNMNVTGTVTQNADTSYTGGIAGTNLGTIENCSFSGTVTASACDMVGGIVGQNNGTMINSRNTATVSGRNFIGGITGRNEGNIDNSYNTGAISGSRYIAGIAGVNTNADKYIKNSYNTGNITANEASQSSMAGGIAGLNQSGATIDACYNTGNVTASTNISGGITGRNSSTVLNCVSLGARVTGTNNVGRVVGTNDSGTISTNKAREDMKIGASGAEAVPTTNIGAGSANGSAVSFGATLSGVFNTGWQGSVWNITGNLNVGVDLPTLKTNTQSPAPTLPAAHSPLGSAENPYLVTNEADLRRVGRPTATDGWPLTAHYRQTANISMTGGNFMPIGNITDKFTGTYDGGGYTITGFSQVTSSSNVGFFGYIGSGGTLKNMNVTGTVTNNGSNISYIGGIAGYNEGTIDNCSFSGTISGTTNDDVGGIAGRNIGTVINSRSAATVSGRTRVGGITGENQGKIDNSYNTGAVTGSQQVGGIAGGNSNSGNYIKNSYNTGNVTATTATTTANAGGIVGQSSALIEYCYNTGNVSGTGNIGGIVGYINPGCTVQYCVSLGARVTGTSTGRVAGTNNGGTLANNKGRADTDGISGVATATSINGENISVGSTTTQSSVFNGWSTTLWNISGNLTAGVNLPTLKTNTQSPAPTLPAAYSPLGSADNPFLVTNETDLRKVGTETTAGGWTVSAHYKQTADITMTGSSFTPIGTNVNKFTGTYDGGGKTITGLSMTLAGNYLALFGNIDTGGTVKNLNVTGTITNSGTSRECTGGIVGLNLGTIDNCSFSGTVTGGTNNDDVGGIAGRNSGTIINSRNSATVSGRTSVGGIAGKNDGTIENSYNTGNITGTNQVGGIAGANSGTGSNIRIRNSYNTGDITATTTSTTANVGGIIGMNQSSSTVEYCYNSGNVSGAGNVGGIAGNNAAGRVQYCVSLGARVTGGTNTCRVVGVMQTTSTLTDNRARADMKIGASGSEAVPTTNIGANEREGIHVSSTSGAQSAVFSGFVSSIWTIPTGNLTIGDALPTLKTNTQSPAPTLPATYVAGTAADPFLVTNATDLRKVGTGTDGWTLSAHYRQTANMAMASTAFPPIGTSTNKFTGSYDGDGKTITGLNLTSTSATYLGLFGYIGEGGTVKNMTVTGTVSNGGNQTTGGIAGANQGTIDNCVFNGTVNGGTSVDQVGGIAGYNFPTGTVINSRNNATITGRTMVGGIAGVNNGKIENSFNTGNVSGNSQVGGVVGTNSSSGTYVKNCYNTGNVTATDSTSNVGGIVGNCQSSSLVEYCYNSGTITGLQYVGGIVGTGDTTANVRYCVSLSTRVITTTNSSYSGRISGIQSITMTGNKARSNLLLGPSSQTTPVTTGTGSNKDGENADLGTTVMNVFNNFDGSIWYIWNTPMNVGGDLPTLRKNEQSPAPTLP